MKDALYLYGFVLASAAPPDGLRGVAGREVALLRLGGLQAAVSLVPGDEFAPDRIKERLRDLDWVAEQGALHERVVTWFVDRGDILPVRLLTLYSGEDALRASVPDPDALLARLQDLRDHREWDLKVSWDPRVLASRLGDVSGPVQDLDRELAAAAPGRRYLLERKRAQIVQEETSRTARGMATVLHELLSRGARESLLLPIPREGADLPVVLSGAYLVERRGEETLAGQAAAERDRLRPLGLDVRFTGPWAPYRFVAGRGGSNAEGQDDGGL